MIPHHLSPRSQTKGQAASHPFSMQQIRQKGERNVPFFPPMVTFLTFTSMSSRPASTDLLLTMLYAVVAAVSSRRVGGIDPYFWQGRKM